MTCTSYKHLHVEIILRAAKTCTSTGRPRTSPSQLCGQRDKTPNGLGPGLPCFRSLGLWSDHHRTDNACGIPPDATGNNSPQHASHLPLHSRCHDHQARTRMSSVETVWFVGLPSGVTLPTRTSCGISRQIYAFVHLVASGIILRVTQSGRAKLKIEMLPAKRL